MSKRKRECLQRPAAAAELAVLPYAMGGEVDVNAYPEYMAPAFDKGKDLNAVSLLYLWKLALALVKDDGSCWAYAVLAHVEGVEGRPLYAPPVCGTEASTFDAETTIPTPSPDERSIQLCVRKLLAKRDPKKFSKHAKKPPKYNKNATKLVRLGSYGGADEWRVLSQEYGVHIVLWECATPEHMVSSKHRFVWIDERDGKTRLLTAAQIRARAEETPDVPIAHVATSSVRKKHFDTLLPVS